MTYLRRLAIRSYRSIRKADLRLGNVTVVIGPTDSGKSNVIRALRDWAYNAGGARFMTQGCRVTRIGVGIGPKLKVVWEKTDRGGDDRRSRGYTRYVVSDADAPGPPVAYEKIGLTVPQEVLDVTGFRPVVIDDVKVKIHFSEQGKPSFLLHSPPWTPAATSKVIGRVSGIDALILANRDLTKRRAKVGSLAKGLRVAADENRGLLEKYDLLDGRLERSAQVAERIQDVEAKQRDLDRALRLVERARAKKAALERLARRTDPLRAVVERYEGLRLDERTQTLSSAEAAVRRVEALEKRVAKAERRIELAQGHLEGCADLLRELAGAEDLECPLCGEPAHPECREALARQVE